MPHHARILAGSVPLLLFAAFVGLQSASGDQPAKLKSETDPCTLVAAYGGIYDGATGSEVQVGVEDREALLERMRVCPERKAGGVLATSGGMSAGSGSDHRADAPIYHQACRDAGVPVPGSFAMDAGWSDPKELDSEAHRYFFRSNWTDAEVRTYRAENGGFCIALARRKPNAPEQVPFIGTICADRLQKNACFFDNIVYEQSGSKRIGWEDFRSRDFSELVHPLDGEDRCNSCHLGKNPFIVHPGTILGNAVQSMYDKNGPAPKRFEFVGLGGPPDPWTNFAPIARDGSAADKCMMCHDLPHVTAGHPFCSGILEMAAKRTMPPGHWPADPTGGPDFWPDDKGCFAEGLDSLKPYFASIVRLKSICSGKPEKTCANGQ